MSVPKTGIKSVGFSNVMATYTAAPNYTSSMDSYRPTNQSGAINTSSAPAQRQDSEDSNSPRGHVSFTKPNRDEEKEKRQKYLTARYGQHQMMLIRKRLAVEDWLYEQLRDLYDCEDDSDDHNCNLDMDDVLNCDTEAEIREYASKELVEAKKAPEVLKKFIDALVEKAKTL
ncbi:protein phosphatase 1 regulatory subunit 14C-like [Pecten maximus]|uniref:protein phosphatase 1 regulatory subunit 14C-like n=1 Tax=Pecten maximus TaxID=6579 RepID=UPI0014588B4E|nr:protein phosphatase 1 regulatory subunit 14C-like [Pecten maximus]